MTDSIGARPPAAPGLEPPSGGTVPLTLQELEGSNLLDMAKDKFKSRLLQRTLVRGGPEIAGMIFRKAEPCFMDLVRDQYGNYLSQKVLEVATAEQFELLFKSLAPKLQELSQDMHGTRAVQKVVEQAVARSKVTELLDALPGPTAEALALNITGFHVVVKMIETLPGPEVQDLLMRLAGTKEKAMRLGKDQWGCCVLKKCVDRAAELGSVNDVMSDAVTQNTAALIEDPFGNYVIQHLIEAQPLLTVPKIVAALKGRIYELCLQKFSSNVLEKCLTNAAERERNTIIKEILTPASVLPSEAVRTLLFHQFGNYVLQQALEVAKEPQFSLLVEHAKAHVQQVLRAINEGAGPDQEPNGLPPEHMKRLSLKLAKRYPHIVEGMEAGWAPHYALDYGGFDPALANFDPALANWMAAASFCWDPPYMPAPTKKGSKGRSRSKGPGKRTKKQAYSTQDIMPVGRIVGFWPNYSIAYDDASAGANSKGHRSKGRGKGNKSSKSLASEAPLLQ